MQLHNTKVPYLLGFFFPWWALSAVPILCKEDDDEDKGVAWLLSDSDDTLLGDDRALSRIFPDDRLVMALVDGGMLVLLVACRLGWFCLPAAPENNEICQE